MLHLLQPESLHEEILDARDRGRPFCGKNNVNILRSQAGFPHRFINARRDPLSWIPKKKINMAIPIRDELAGEGIVILSDVINVIKYTHRDVGTEGLV